MASNRRRNLLSLKRGRYAGFFSIKFLLFFVCRKGRNKICYIRHIFSVFLKFTPKFGRVLLRSLDEMGKDLRKSAEVFSTQIARMERTVFETLMFKNCLTKCR